eukprot:TRINITY_DN462_c0_g5_i1.p1 TRINITY_DN462_c0_g5~~TRINITY_DN462_c0_g5_i1.p1  ORF type:complete len:317 (-),score=55.91 TRINITY_DN462_c0_g5_i1:471-1421(-)
MVAARSKRGPCRAGERAKVLGGLGVLGLGACAAVMLTSEATTFVSTGALPLTSASRPAGSPVFATAPSASSAGATVSSQAFAACMVVAAASLTRVAFAKQSSSSRRSASRAVVCCATPVPAPVEVPTCAPVQLPPSLATPLIELGEPTIVHAAAPPVAAIPLSPQRSYTGFVPQVPSQASVNVAAAPAEETRAADAFDATPSASGAFAGARAARVIGGMRYTASRGGKRRSNKSIRCYVAPKFTEVVPLKLAYDPSRLDLAMQAGLQVPSRIRKVYSRERKNSVACRTAGSGTGVRFQSMYFCAKRFQDTRALTIG